MSQYVFTVTTKPLTNQTLSYTLTVILLLGASPACGGLQFKTNIIAPHRDKSGIDKLSVFLPYNWIRPFNGRKIVRNPSNTVCKTYEESKLDYIDYCIEDLQFSRIEWSQDQSYANIGAYRTPSYLSYTLMLLSTRQPQ